MSSVSSPPTMTTGRRMRTQRRSRGAAAITLDDLASVLERLVSDRVVHRDDLAVDVDRVRHVHVAAERPAHAFGDHRLAVAGRAVEEHRLAGVDRRAELLEHLVADDECEKPLRSRSRSM